MLKIQLFLQHNPAGRLSLTLGKEIKGLKIKDD